MGRALVVGTVPPFLGSRNLGGVAQVVWSLAEALRDAGVEFQLLPIGKYYGGTKEIEGITIIGVGPHFKSIVRTFRDCLTHRALFRGMLLKDRLHLLYAIYAMHYANSVTDFDCIHVHHVYNKFPTAARIVVPDVPVVATVHSYHGILMADSERRARRLTEDRLEQLSRVDFVTHVSRDVRNTAGKVGVTWDCDDRIIYNGVRSSPSLIARLDAIPFDRRRVAFAGSLLPRKGIWRLLDAMALLKDTELAVAGRGRLRDEIETRIVDEGLAVRMLGYLSEDDVLELMAGSAVFVMPSRSESFGLVYVESLLAGTPVIGHHRILREFHDILRLEPPLSRWLVPYRHEQESGEDLARKIAAAMSIKGRPSYLRERELLRAKINEVFNWKGIALQYAEIYDTVRRNEPGGGGTRT